MKGTPLHCPNCRKGLEGDAAREEKNAFYPFCSERCRLIDLGNWLDGKYRVSDSLKSDAIQQAGRFSTDGEDSAADFDGGGY